MLKQIVNGRILTPQGWLEVGCSKFGYKFRSKKCMVSALISCCLLALN